jgi:hypothetical protein
VVKDLEDLMWLGADLEVRVEPPVADAELQLVARRIARGG